MSAGTWVVGSRACSSDRGSLRAMSSMTRLVLVDQQDRELGRCGVESWVTFEAGHSVDLGPVGYFRFLDVRSNDDPKVVVVEPTERIAPGTRL